MNHTEDQALTRDSMVFYRSFYEAVKELPAEQFKACVTAVVDYGLDGIPPDGNGIEKTVYMMAKPQIDANNRRYLNGTKGGRPITKPEPNDNQTETTQKLNRTKPEPNVNVNEYVNDIKEIPSNEGTKKKRVAFVPPTLENVRVYCQENGLEVDAERFIDFYTSKDWMVGKNKMKDWKAAVRNWNRQGKGPEKQYKTAVDRYNQGIMSRDLDLDSLEKELLGG